jgi:predicted nucleic acid-binding protein
MNLSNIASGSSVFIDSNIFIYSFAPEPQFGPSCEQLLERIERQDVHGVTSSHVLSDVAHRLMSIEACATFGWSYAGIAAKLKKHQDQIQKLGRFRQAIAAILLMNIEVLSVSARHIESATTISQAQGLMSNDALIISLMQDTGLNQLASHDSDFDRVPGVVRFGLI